MRRRSLQSGFTILETLFVVALIGIISVMAMPMVGNTLADFRVSGDVRGAANAVALSKMRAASKFSRVRLYVEVAANRYRLEVFDKTSAICCWQPEGGYTYLSTGTSFGYGPVTSPPPSSQGAISQAAPCVNDTGAAVGNTACVIFNSRGTPVTSANTVTTEHALYIENKMAVYAITVAATGMIRTWRTGPLATPSWVVQ
jgi:prepilin-type N-terminal cleavage/methylation domain-containing protein